MFPRKCLVSQLQVNKMIITEPLQNKPTLKLKLKLYNDLSHRLNQVCAALDIQEMSIVNKKASKNMADWNVNLKLRIFRYYSHKLDNDWPQCVSYHISLFVSLRLGAGSSFGWP